MRPNVDLLVRLLVEQNVDTVGEIVHALAEGRLVEGEHADALARFFFEAKRLLGRDDVQRPSAPWAVHQPVSEI